MKKILAALAGALYLSSWGAFAQQPALNDGQILSVMTVANDLDIGNGKLAEKKATDPNVKSFAQRMVADHQQANDSGKAVSKQIKVSPQDNATSDQLKSTGKETMSKLKDLKGSDFDRAYIDSEVAMHQMVLDTIDNSLMPNAKSSEVKTLLSKTRPVIASHLDQAKQIQAALGKSGAKVGFQ